MALPTTPVTPTTPAGNKASTPATGTWRHPRFEEIARRQNATMFGEKNVSQIVWNSASLFLTFHVDKVLGMLPQLYKLLSPLAPYPSHAMFLLRLLFFINILVAIFPLIRRKDDLSDIPLTPSQRALLGLDPNVSSPATPGGTFITPPRYALSSTPRSSTPPSRNSAYSTSPLSGYGSQVSLKDGQGGSSFSPASPSPLLQKALGARDSTRRASYGSPSPNGIGAGVNSTSLVGLPSTPSPVSGKGSSVGLNNRWLYERGRASPGGRSVYS